MEVKAVSIAQEASHLRVDAWLATLYPEVPKRVLRAWIDEGSVSKAGKKCSKGDRVLEGECYHLRGEPRVTTLMPNAAIAVNVVYEDEDFIAVNKPAGQNCQPNAVDEIDTLANGLLARWDFLVGIGDSPLTCGILHRIDGDTSGLVLVAKSQVVYEAMRAQFAAREVEKHYRALVCGAVNAPGHLEHYLAHNPRCPGRMVDAAVWRDVKRPMFAVTDYRPMHTVKVGAQTCTLLDVCILTGVTHQIRAQLSFAGFPILGDVRYGGRSKEMALERHFLHAYTATFKHPRSQQLKTLKAPLTEDFRRILGHQS